MLRKISRSNGEDGDRIERNGNVHVQEGLMARRHWVCVFAFVLALVGQPVAPRAQQTPETSTAIAVRTATADGVSVQYLRAGSGPAIVLLHGYAETSRMWRPLVPRLAAAPTGIGPDRPGVGGSAIPDDGPDMAHAAARMP